VVVDHGCSSYEKKSTGFCGTLIVLKKRPRSTAGHLESGRGDFHFHEPCARIWGAIGEFTANAGRSLDILGEEEDIATTASAGEFRSGGPIRHAGEDFPDLRRICAGVEGAVEFPASADDTAEVFP
jgi:hypothetical protein